MRLDAIRSRKPSKNSFLLYPPFLRLVVRAAHSDSTTESLGEINVGKNRRSAITAVAAILGDALRRALLGCHWRPRPRFCRRRRIRATCLRYPIQSVD